MGNYYGVVWSYGNSLSHHGILGQKWGVRRFQNEDGTLTPAGRKRYGENSEEARAYMEKAEAKYRRKQTSKNAKEANEAKQVYRRLRRAEGHDPHKEIVEEADSISKNMENYDKLDASSKKDFSRKLFDVLEKAEDYYDDTDNYSAKAEGNDKKWDDVLNRETKLKDWLYTKTKDVATKYRSELSKIDNEKDGLTAMLNYLGFDSSDSSIAAYKAFLYEIND